MKEDEVELQLCKQCKAEAIDDVVFTQQQAITQKQHLFRRKHHHEKHVNIVPLRGEVFRY